MSRLKIGKYIDIENAILLAPMEDITEQPFRIICKKFGADIVYSEFISSEALYRHVQKSIKKIVFTGIERPIGIQIFGANDEPMMESAKLIESFAPDLIDINYGCRVQNVVKNKAGAFMLKQPERMQELTRKVVESVSLPVTVKTRLGWNKNSIFIEEVAKKLEDAGISALTIHCRTREEAHKSQADWSWIPKVKKVVSIPVILNGDVKTFKDVLRAFNETGCDGVMIGRAAIGNPFIFAQAKEFLHTGKSPLPPTIDEKINICLEHLKLNIAYKGERLGIIEFRKFYSGYLKGIPNVSSIRQKLVTSDSFVEIEETLNNFLQYFKEKYPIGENLIYNE